MEMPTEQSELQIRILDLCAGRMLIHGFHQVNLDDISSELGISKKTLYREFRSRKELNMAVVDYFFASIQTRLNERVFGSEQSALGTSDRLALLFSEVASSISQLNFKALAELEERDPKLWQRISTRRNEVIHRSFGALLKEGRIRGELPGDINPGFLEHAVAAIIQTLGTPRHMMELGLTPRDFIENLTAFVSRGIGKGAST